MKKVLIFITGPYQLLQALWYFSYCPDAEFTAIVKTAVMPEENRIKLLEQCKKSGVFREVREYTGVSLDSGMIQKIKMMLQMVGHFCTGRRNHYTRKLIRNEIGDISYDQVVVDSEHSIMGGAFIDNADKTETIIMQEGLSDLLARSRRFQKGKGIGFILATLGYCNPGMTYILPKVKYCKKMTSMEELLQYKGFAGFIPLFSQVRDNVFQNVVRNTFELDDWGIMQRGEVFLFTNPLEKIGGDDGTYEEIHQWMKEHFGSKKIVIKKHPRDMYSYDWKDLDIEMLEAGIPAEVLISQISSGKEMLFMFISTCIVDLFKREADYKIFHFRSVQGEYYADIFPQLRKKLGIKDKYIVEI